MITDPGFTTDSSILIPGESLKVGKEIGKGNFGSVYLGEWNGNKGFKDLY